MSHCLSRASWAHCLASPAHPANTLSGRSLHFLGMLSKTFISGSSFLYKWQLCPIRTQSPLVGLVCEDAALVSGGLWSEEKGAHRLTSCELRQCCLPESSLGLTLA